MPDNYLATVSMAGHIAILQLRGLNTESLILIQPSFYRLPNSIPDSFNSVSNQNNTIFISWRDSKSSFPSLIGLRLNNILHTARGLPAVSSCLNMKMSSLISDPMVCPSSFYYMQDKEICEYYIKDGQSSRCTDLPILGTDVNYFSIDYRPFTEKVSDKQFLISYRSNETSKEEVLFINMKSEHKKLNSVSGINGILLGELEELAINYLVLDEEGQKVIMYTVDEPDTYECSLIHETFSIHWTFMQNGYVVLYDTLKGIMLSKNALTGKPEDVQICEKYVITSRERERINAVRWNIEIKQGAIATQYRIILVSPKLEILTHFDLFSIPISVYWYGYTLIVSTTRDVKYCVRNQLKTIIHTFNPSVICGALKDRLILADVENKLRIKVFPVNMLEPLLYGYISNKDSSNESIKALVETMKTNQISEDFIELLLENGLNEAALFLLDENEAPQLSLKLRLKALKSLNRVDDIYEVLMKNKDLYNINQQLLEYQTDPKWRATKSLIEQHLPYLEMTGQLNKYSTCAQYVSHTEKLEHMKYQFNFSNISEVPDRFKLNKTLNFEEAKNEDICSFSDFDIKSPYLSYHKKLVAFGENPFIQTLSNRERIYSVQSENINQVFGYNSLKEVAFKPEPITEIFEEIKQESDIVSEDVKLLRYFRCDESKGDIIVDLVTDEEVTIPEEAWGDQLDDGEPLDYEDKWGRKCHASYSLNANQRDEGLFKVGFKDGSPTRFTYEMWIKVNEASSGWVVKIGSMKVLFQDGKFACKLENSIVPFNPIKESEEESDSATPNIIEISEWQHICVLYQGSKVKLYLNSQYVGMASIGKNSADIIVLGKFDGWVTEIRVWSGFRGISEVRDNMRCPLEILSDKKKRNWTAMKIVKKPEEGESKTALKLQPPKLGQFKSLLAPPKPVKKISTEEQKEGV